MFLIKTAFRNIFRHKRRTAFNVVAFLINVFCIVFFTSFYRGVMENGYKYRIDYLTSHIQIHNPDYEKNKRKLPLDITVKETDRILADLKDNTLIQGISKRIEFGVRISKGRNQMGCLGVAIQPENEKRVGVIAEKIVEGKYLKDGEQGIIIGKRLADLLDIKVGDVVLLYFYTAFNQPNIIDVPVVGLFNFQFSGIDKSMVYVPFDFIQPFLNMPEGATKIMIRLKDQNKIPDMMTFLDRYNNEFHNGTLQINDWKYFSKSVIQELEAGQSRLSVFYFILIIVAIFGIMNTMSTTVFERTQEIGTIRAIGLKKKQTLGLILLESTMISFLGVLLGWILGFLLSYYLSKTGIKLYDISQTDTYTTPVPEKMHNILGASEYIGTLILGIAAGVLGSVAPALKVLKLKIVDALRK